MMNPRARPKRITLLAWAAMLFAAWNALRLGEAIYLYRTLLELRAPAFYIAFTGAAWCVIGLILAWGLWKGRNWAWWGSLGTALAYAAWYWIDRLFVQMPHANIAFSILSTAILLAIIILVLLTRRARNFFRREPHERKPQN